MNIFREAFKIFDRNHDGTITLNEFKKVTDILGTILSQEEVDEFMKEADKVYYDDLFNSSFDVYIWILGWRRNPGYWWVCECVAAVWIKKRIIFIEI